jgi:hypothetical protein
MRSDILDKKISKFLLSNIKFHIGEKVLKRGQLILFKIKEFYYVFTIKNEKGELKEYQLPYPFEIIEDTDSLGFSYKLDKFYNKNEFVEFKIKVIERNKKNKLYDSIVVLSIDR